MSVTVRFAPSPTGHLHIGNARTALFNALFAMKAGGRFILRLDDTDLARSTEAFAAAIVDDLAWLGVRPDLTIRQTDRADRHHAVTGDLRARRLLYPCYETADELDRARARRRLRGLPPVYDRAALRLSDGDRARLEGEGRRPHWRFLLPNHDGDPFAPRRTEIRWTDLCRGEETVDLASLSDPVLVRADGTWLYTLPSVVDDVDLGVTHVIRGEDHVTNTGVQIALFEAIAGRAPAFGHHNLFVDAAGAGLSKRTGSASLRGLRAEGYEPEAVAVLAVTLGTSRPAEPVAALADLADGFDLATVSRSPARFDLADLDALNARTVHTLPFARVKDRLAALGIPPDPAFWAAVSGNCEKLSDAAFWWRVVTGPVDAAADPADVAFLAEAARSLPAEPYDTETFRTFADGLKDRTGRKGRALFQPLRRALTGLDHGPEMAALLPLIGRERALSRFEAAIVAGGTRSDRG
jgi:glutamyl-tRNA synthetase